MRMVRWLILRICECEREENFEGEVRVWIGEERSGSWGRKVGMWWKGAKGENQIL